MSSIKRCVSQSVSEWVTRSPIELSWTAKNAWIQHTLSLKKKPELKIISLPGNLSIPCVQFRKLNLKIRQWHWHSFNWGLWKLNGVVHEMTFEWEIEFCKSHSSIPNVFVFYGVFMVCMRLQILYWNQGTLTVSIGNIVAHIHITFKQP